VYVFRQNNNCIKQKWMPPLSLPKCISEPINIGWLCQQPLTVMGNGCKKIMPGLPV
jgi:hypothetical protein